MRIKVFAGLFLLLSGSPLLAEVKVWDFTLGPRNNGTGGQCPSFLVGNIEKKLSFNIHSLSITRTITTWYYSFDGCGDDSKRPDLLEAAQLNIIPQEGHSFKPVSGNVKFDWDKKTVTIALKIKSGDAVVDFIGNGTLAWKDMVYH